VEIDDIISYHDVVTAENASLQKGMNHGVGKNYSVFLMSLREGAPYADALDEVTGMLRYEGHDEPQLSGGSNPKEVDQPLTTPRGSWTENGKFFRAAMDFKSGLRMRLAGGVRCLGGRSHHKSLMMLSSNCDWFEIVRARVKIQAFALTFVCRTAYSWTMLDQGDDLISALELLRQNSVVREVFQTLAEQLGRSGWGVAKGLDLNPKEVASALEELKNRGLIRASDTGLEGNYTLTPFGFALREQMGSRYSRSRLQ
jgi:predicted transcriptional regulator